MAQNNSKQPISDQEENKNYNNELKTGLAMVQAKDLSFNTRKIIDENKLKEAKKKLINELFHMMETLGVNLNDLQSINQFLQKLDTIDPDLRELFEVSFNNLINDGDVNPQAPAKETPNENEGLMGRDLSQEQLMPR